MKATIDLTPDEQRIVDIYLDPSLSRIPRAIRLSIQYAIGSGIFIVLAIWKQEPLYALVVYGVFLLYMLLRILGAKRASDIMPSVIRKYEKRIRELESEAAELQSAIER